MANGRGDQRRYTSGDGDGAGDRYGREEPLMITGRAVSACVSSLIPSAVRHPGRLAAMAAMAAMSPQGLLEALSAVARALDMES